MHAFRVCLYVYQRQRQAVVLVFSKISVIRNFKYILRNSCIVNKNQDVRENNSLHFFDKSSRICAFYGRCFFFHKAKSYALQKRRKKRFVLLQMHLCGYFTERKSSELQVFPLDNSLLNSPLGASFVLLANSFLAPDMV